MSLYQKIVDLRNELRHTDPSLVTRLLSPLLGDIQLEQSKPANRGKSLDEIATAIVKRFYDGNTEFLNIESITAVKRVELVQERNLLETLRPVMMTPDQLEAITKAEFGDKLEAKQKGQVFAYFKKNYANQYDGTVLGAVIQTMTA